MTSRRKFIKESLFSAGAIFFIPSFLRTEIKAGPPFKLNYKPEPEKWKDTAISLAWIGHSTILINFFGCQIYHLRSKTFRLEISVGTRPFTRLYERRTQLLRLPN